MSRQENLKAAGTVERERTIVLAATSNLRPCAFLNDIQTQVPKVNHDVLCGDRREIGECCNLVDSCKRVNSYFKQTIRSKHKQTIKKKAREYMKLRNSVVVAAAVAMAGMIQTAQAAFSDNLADLVSSGGSLTIGDKTFSGFSIVSSGLTSFNAANIIVTASQNGGIDYLTWSGNISLVGGGPVTADLKLNYIVSASAGAINMIDQAYTGSALGGGLLAIDETVATGSFGGTVVGNSNLSKYDLSDPPAEATDNLNIVPPQTLLYVTKDISLANPNTSITLVTISQVSQSFHQVPEPTTVLAGTLLLLPLGASTLRILRRNRMS
jgi:hypothetical protein